MPTYTKQDVLDKIQDISTNFHSCLTALSAKGVTVPADASLDDLGGLIRQIPDASHPDIDLPWIMTNGLTFFTISQTMQRTRSFYTDIELAPVTIGKVIWGCRSNDSIQGNSNLILYYTDTSVYSYRRLLKNLGTASQTADVNNYAQKAWSGYPFYKKQRLAASYNSTSDYRASVQYNGSWTTAGSSMAQQSSSHIPDTVQTLFARANFTTNGLTMEAFCPAGTKIYWTGLTSGNKDTNVQHEYEPILHWDVSTNQYLPCFINKANGNLGSYPKATKEGWADGTAYYIDVTQGYQERSGANTDGTSVWRCDTDIPNSSAYTIMMGVNQAEGNDNYTEYFMDIYGVPANTYFMNITSTPYSSGNTARIRYHEQLQEGVSIIENYDTYVYTGQSASNNVICIDPANNTTWYSNVTNITDSKHSTALTGKSTAPDASRGYYRIYNPYYGSASINRILYWVAIYEGTTLKHYLVNCTKQGTNGLMYDVVTKKSYNFYKV